MESKSGAMVIKYLTNHQAVRFGVIGGAAFLIDAGGAWVYLHFLPKLAALALAYLGSCVFHYLCSKRWTFGDRTRVTARQIWAYALTNLTTLAMNTVLSAWLLERTGHQLLLSKAIALPPTSVLGFFLLRGFVFARPPAASAS